MTAAIVAGSGCGQKHEVQKPPPAMASTDTSAVQTAQTSAASVDLPEIQRSLLRWMLANHRRPASFEEFAAMPGVQIPPPPPGMKYVLKKDMHVALVNR
jgi:hypothetical protein